MDYGSSRWMCISSTSLAITNSWYDCNILNILHFGAYLLPSIILALCPSLQCECKHVQFWLFRDLCWFFGLCDSNPWTPIQNVDLFIYLFIFHMNLPCTCDDFSRYVPQNQWFFAHMNLPCTCDDFSRYVLQNQWFFVHMNLPCTCDDFSRYVLQNQWLNLPCIYACFFLGVHFKSMISILRG